MFNNNTKTQDISSANSSIDPSKIRVMKDDLAGVPLPAPPGASNGNGISSVAKGSETSDDASIVFDRLPDIAPKQARPTLPTQQVAQTISNATPPVSQTPPRKDGFDLVQGPAREQKLTDNSASGRQTPSINSLPSIPTPDSTTVSPRDNGGASGVFIKTVSNNDSVPAPTVKNTGSIIVEQKKGSPALYAVATLIVLVLFGAGGYYYWETRMKTPVAVIPGDDVIGEDVTEDPSDDIDEKALTVSAPNTIEVDSAKPFRSQYDQLADAMTDLKVGDAAQIVFVKKPATSGTASEELTAGEFIESLGLNFAPEISRSFTGKMRYFLVNDMNGARAVALFQVSDLPTTKQALTKNEASVAVSASKLFTRPVSLSGPAVFQDSTHRSYAIRFYNINALDPSSSIDYVFRNDELIIGTSKESIRTVLDRLDQSGAY